MELPELVVDLAVILLIAGITTIICQKLKQPVILGYIIAGFIAGPNFTLFPTITNPEIVQNWSEIGVIILLFALGLEFSFYKLKKIGGPSFIATFIIMMGVMLLGYLGGLALHWSNMNSIFLGAMLSMSSTAIIAKNFESMHLKSTGFEEFVIGILVMEDVFSILLIVILTTIAQTQAIPEIKELAIVLFRLLFYLILWFVCGMFLIPTFFKKVHSLTNNETILVLALGLCFGMTIIVTKMGVSAALGAFMMGSFIAETPDIEKIQHLIAPIKDLFGAIFFVSVGMLVNPYIMIDYFLPILAIVFIALIGKFIIAFIGSIVAGYNLEDSMRSSFSLAPIGEFSFIIASIGITHNVIDSFLYPIIVAVASITIFAAPYCLKSADFCSLWLEKVLPKTITSRIYRYSKNNNSHDNNEWQTLISDLLTRCLVIFVILLAISLGANTYLEKYMNSILPHPYSNLVTSLISFVFMAPFLTNLLANKTAHPELFTTLWFRRRSNHLPLIILFSTKMILAAGFIFYFFIELVEISLPLSIIASVISIIIISTSDWFLGEYLHIESQFITNLNQQHSLKARKKLNIVNPNDAIVLFDEQIFLAKYHLEENTPNLSLPLKKINIRKISGCNVLQCKHKEKVTNMPDKDYVLYPNSDILLIGTKDQITRFSSVSQERFPNIREIMPPISLRDFTADKELNPPDSAFIACAITIDNYSELIGKSLMSTSLREEWHCMIIGLERGLYINNSPHVATVFEKGDVLWVLGKQDMINKLVLKEIL